MAAPPEPTQRGEASTGGKGLVRLATRPCRDRSGVGRGGTRGDFPVIISRAGPLTERPHDNVPHTFARRPLASPPPPVSRTASRERGGDAKASG
jgi:hypothetical protein